MKLLFMCDVYGFFYRHQQYTLIYEEHERCFLKIRNQGVPKAPHSAKDIKDQISRPEIFDTYCKSKHTDGQKKFLDYVHEGTDFNYCIFSSKHIINMIQQKIVPAN